MVSTDIKKDINVFSENIFNLNDENTIKTPWRNLNLDKKSELLDNFFKAEFNNQTTEKTIDVNTIFMIKELVSNGKIKLNKEIKYDKVNERIIQISALVPEQHTDFYVYKPELLVKKEKSKKIAKNILFRKR